MPKIELIQGDCLEKMKDIETGSVDAIVTDPPYGLSFMGKHWDKGVPGVHFWQEMIRVLKPGGYLLSFSGTRTYHRMACAIEDGGFEIRDMIEWVYGSGFPKSLNIGKAVDKLQGNEREFVSENPANRPYNLTKGETSTGWKSPPRPDKTKGTSEWEGWGTALKPAHEPICMARKPLSEKTVAENVLKWGTGGINVDESRVESGGEHKRPEQPTNAEGRWPANLIHDGSEEVRECFPETKSWAIKREVGGYEGHSNTGFLRGVSNPQNQHGDSGNASRFFKSIIYQAKASKAERNKGCEGLEEKRGGSMMANTGETMGLGGASLKGEPKEKQPDKNNHPTVKPTAIMEYLINMVTKEGGTVLDPFTGSGSTGVACKNLNRNFIGIELDHEYFKIAEKRINGNL